jgi:hypothetical protein
LSRLQVIEHLDGRHIQDAVASLACALAQGDSQVSLAQSNCAHEHDVRVVLEELEAEELFDGHLVDLLGPAPLVLIEGLTIGEASVTKTSFQLLLTSLQDLAFDEAV